MNILFLWENLLLFYKTLNISFCSLKEAVKYVMERHMKEDFFSFRKI